MGFNTNTPRAEYIASAGQQDFDFVFKIYETSDINVYQEGSLLALGSGYTISINGDDGGTVSLVNGATLEDEITIARDLTITRETEYQDNGDWLADAINEDQDYQTYLLQDIDSSKNEFLKLPESAQNISNELPTPDGDQYIRWNAAGTALINDNTYPSAIQTAVDAADDAQVDRDAVQILHDTVVSKEALVSPHYSGIDRLGTDETADNIDTVAANIGDVNTVADDMDAVKDVSANINGSAINYNVNTVGDLASIATPSINDTVVVTEEGRGGVFIYRVDGTSDGGTIFDSSSTGKWHRQYEDEVHVAWFGASAANTDNTTAIRNAINTNAKIINFAPVTYDFNSYIIITKDITINGNGAKLNGTSLNAYVRVFGEIEDEIAITSPITMGDNNIVAANTLEAEDIVIIRDDTDYSYSNHRSYYKKGEYIKVKSSNGTSFDVEGGVRQPFNDTTNLKVSRLLPITVHIDNLSIYNQEANDYVLSLKYTKDSIVTNCNINGGVLRAFTAVISYNTIIKDCSFHQDTGTLSGYDYGLSISNCAFTYVTNCNIHGARHATGIGGSNENGSVPNYITYITDCRLSNNVASNLYVADVHGNSESTKYEGCNIQGAIAVSGENTTYINNSITLLTDRPAIDLTEVVGGEMRIEGNLVSVIGNASGVYNTVMKTSSTSFTDDITYDTTYVVKNNIFALSANINYLILLYKSGVGEAILNLIYENNRFRNDCSGLTTIVRNYNYNYLPKKQEFITIKDFHQHSTMSSSVQIFVQAGGSVQGTKLTLPKIGYTKILSTLAGDYQKTIYFTFPFDYGTYKPGYSANLRNCGVSGAAYPFVELNGSTLGVNTTVTSGNVGETFGGDRDWEVSLEFGGTEIIA